MEEPEWTTTHHLVGSEVTVPVIANGSRTTVSTKVTHFGPPDPTFRRPPLWRAHINQTAYDLTASELQSLNTQWKNVPTAQARYQMHILKQIEATIWPTILSTAIVEEILTQYTRGQTQTIQFTPSMILSRIQAACVIVQGQQNAVFNATLTRRSSSRLVQTSSEIEEDLWKVQPGGRIARRIYECLDNAVLPKETNNPDQDLAVNNPYLPNYLDSNAVLEFIGKKTKQMSMADLQNYWNLDEFFEPTEADQELLDAVGDIHLAPAVPFDVEELEPSQFGKTLWNIMEDKTDHARIVRMEEGYSLWPNWREEMTSFCEKFVYAPMTDEELARELEEQQTGGGGRSTRGRTVFYGTQSFTQKQLMDAILRQMSDASFVTLMDVIQLIPSDSSDPMRRIRTALGKLVFKRKQCTRRICQPRLGDIPPTMNTYVQQLRATEHEIRELVLKQLSVTHTSILATAADERAGTMDTLDEEDYDSLEWKTEGHDFIGKEIFRPPVHHSTDALVDCMWYVIESHSESIVSTNVPEEKPDPIGNAKEPVMVERRKRFAAAPRDDEGTYLFLTEGQVLAGLEAAEFEIKENQGLYHPFAKDVGSKVSLVSHGENPAQLHGTIAGLDSPVVDGIPCHKILVLPDENSFQTEAFWASMSIDKAGVATWSVAGDDHTYTIQQFDYDVSSEAYKQCINVLSYLEKNPKAGAFLEPVDPVALGVPQYFEVIKEPMDISTVAKKLREGSYATIPPNTSVGRSPVSKMLNGPFRRDIQLIFDNAMTFNPPDDWIHITAKTLKNSVLKKIEQISKSAEENLRGDRTRKSIYVDDDSDLDYVYEYESDEEFTTGRGRKRKRQEKSVKEDSAARPVEKGIRLEKMLDADGVRGPLAGLPISSDPSSFTLPSDWLCKKSFASGENTAESELELLRSLQQTQDVIDQASYRRTRTQETVESSSKKVDLNVEYYLPGQNVKQSLRSRREIEVFLESLHEENAKLSAACFTNRSFPPYLGRVVNGTWEIRSQHVPAALRWVFRGLVASEHLNEDENVYIVNHAYYIDPSTEPLEQLDTREVHRRKKKEEEVENEEEDVELSEYEKLRAERVARNAERLKLLGLT